MDDLRPLAGGGPSGHGADHHEPDADLLDEVRRKLPLGRHAGIKVRTTDGRSGLAAMPADYADALIVDAFDGLHVPGSLATAEFFADAGRVLRPDGWC